MTDLTPARLRDAAETLRLLVTRYGLAAKRAFDHAELDGYADRLEHEQAAEAKRDKRVEELARELYSLYVAGGRGKAQWVDAAANPHHIETARALLDRYPALAEALDCGHPNHGGDNHDCTPFRSFDE